MKQLPLHLETYKILLAEFSRHIDTLDYAKGSRLMFPACVNEFFYRLQEQGIRSVKQVNSTHVVAHYEYLRTRPNMTRGGVLSDSSLRHHLYSIRLFFDYMMDTEQLESTPISTALFSFVITEPRQVLTLEEVELLYKSCQSKRERCIISLAFGLGLRKSEMEALSIRDIDYHRAQVTVRKGKGYKRRVVPMNERVLTELKGYFLSERQKLVRSDSPDSRESFMLNTCGRRMKGADMNDKLKEIILRTQNKTIEAKRITLHGLRHSIGVLMLENGATVEYVRDFLGHSEIDTTLIYTRRRKKWFALNR